MVSGESQARRGNILRRVPVALWRTVCKCFVKSSLESSNRRPRYFTVLYQGMVTLWNWRGCGSGGRRFVNNMSSVLEEFTRSFHLLKYLSSWDMVELSLRVMVSGLQEWDKMAISSITVLFWLRLCLHMCATWFGLYLGHP